MLTNTEIAELEQWILENVTDTGHSLLSPSGASSWMGCPGYMLGINEARKINKDILQSVEGTVGHFLLEISLIHKVSPFDITENHITPEIAKDVKQWGNGVHANKHNDDEVQQYVHTNLARILKGDFDHTMRHEIDRCFMVIMTYVKQGYTLIPEQKVHLKRFVGHNQCDGTSDVTLFKGTHLITCDLKYGIGIEVSPIKNKQLRIYAAGVIDYVYQTFGVLVDIVDIVIMQPRINNGVWKSWRTNYGEVYEFMGEVKKRSIIALGVIKNPNSVKLSDYRPSNSACTWCHHRGDCKAQLNMITDSVTKAFALAGVGITSMGEVRQSIDVEAVLDAHISDTELAEVLLSAPFITSYLTTLQKEANARVLKGSKIPGMKLVEGRNSRKWKIANDDERIKHITKEYGVPLSECFNPKLKSPAQFDNVKMPHDMRKRFKDEMILTTKGADILVHESDPREETSRFAKVQKGFEQFIKKSNKKA